jgi:hypothetical protein
MAYLGISPDIKKCEINFVYTLCDLGETLTFSMAWKRSGVQFPSAPLVEFTTIPLFECLSRHLSCLEGHFVRILEGREAVVVASQQSRLTTTASPQMIL